MNNGKINLLVICILIILMVTACQKSVEPESSEDTNTGIIGNVDITVMDVQTGNEKDHEDASDYVWDNSQHIPIILNGNSITASTDKATVNGSTVTITSAGNYNICGSLSDGQVIVNTVDEETVRLILSGVDIRCSTTSPIYIENAKKVIIVLADNTENKITDGGTYSFADALVTEPNAAVFSTSDLTICGNGSLIVKGNYNDGIASKDGLIIKNGNINVNSIDDGIRGKDYLVIKNGKVTVNALGDGLKSDNEDDTDRGFISIENGELNITSRKDAVTATTDVIITAGVINLTSGGGSSYIPSSTTSSKAVKGIVSVIIDNGNFSISSADDAIHSNSKVIINGGTFAIASGDDGIHADSVLGINGGSITITKAFEGLESANLTINDGNIHITSSDDGINGAGGNDGSGMHGWPGGLPSSGNYYLYINGGYIYVNATGDGIDINGSIVMTGGEVIVNGPTANDNGALDYDGSFKLSGGFLLGVGSSGMAQAPGTTSTQYSLLLNLKSSQQVNTLLHIQSSDGSDIVTFKPVKKYQSIVFSSAKLIKGSAYDVYFGGNDSGTSTDGLYSGGSYTPGTKFTSFTVSSIVTKLYN